MSHPAGVARRALNQALRASQRLRESQARSLVRARALGELRDEMRLLRAVNVELGRRVRLAEALASEADARSNEADARNAELEARLVNLCAKANYICGRNVFDPMRAVVYK